MTHLNILSSACRRSVEELLGCNITDQEVIEGIDPWLYWRLEVMVAAAVKPFAIEQWMDKYENFAKYNIAESCAASISLQDLQQLSDRKDLSPLSIQTQKLTYGHIRGSPELRENIAGLYSDLKPENVLVTPGGISANLSAFYALVRRGDHVICHYPTYQQLYEVPASLGAEVSLWRAKEEQGWSLDLDDLQGLLQDNTRLIVINNPNNPTGAVIPTRTLEGLVSLAKERNIVIMSDEAYRPLFHSVAAYSQESPPSLAHFRYEKILVTGSMSKAYSLAGIRVGWIASRSDEIISACSQARDYTVISVSQLDDQVAAYALGQHCVHNLLSQNIRLARNNLAIVDKFVTDHSEQCSFARPIGGSTIFVKFLRGGRPLDDVALCEYLIKELGLFASPGSLCFGNGADFYGYLRIGFCCETQVLEAALEVLGGFLNSEAYVHLPTIDVAFKNK